MRLVNLRLVSLCLLIGIIIWIWININKPSGKSLSIESFEVESKFKINFMSIPKAQEIIRRHHSSYFKRMKPMEIVARNVISDESEFYQSDIVSKIEHFYCSHILEFSSLEQKLLKELIIQTVKKSPNKQLSKYFLDWNLIKVDNYFEDGLPHTINEYIVIPEDFVLDIQKLFESNQIKDAIINYGSTLTHEQVHVLQRVHPSIFDRLYVHYWRYTSFPEEPINLLINHYVGPYQRLNPDGLNNNYLFKLTNNQYLIVYVKLKDEHLENVTKYGLTIKRPGFRIQSNKFLNEYSDYINYFGGIGNNYHPNELIASLLSEYIMLPEYYKNQRVHNCQALMEVKRWIKTL